MATSICTLLMGAILRNTEYYNDLESFPAKLIQWRWNSVVEFIMMMLPYKALLQRFWNEKKFQFGNSNGIKEDTTSPDDEWVKEEVAAASAGGTLKLITEALHGSTSDYFFAQTHTVLSLSHVTVELSGWSEGCQCHEHLHKQATTFFHRRSLLRGNLLG